MSAHDDAAYTWELGSPLPLSEAELAILREERIGVWTPKLIATIDVLRADLTAAQEETVEWQARALTESAKRIEEIKERDRTYLAVQKAWDEERDGLAERLEKAKAALQQQGPPRRLPVVECPGISRGL